jgi:hypothetical protein
MKWALLAVAAVSLIVCWHLGQAIHIRSTGETSDAGMIAFAIASPSWVGIIMAGLVGMVSVIGAAKIQVSEIKHKERGQ